MREKTAPVKENAAYNGHKLWDEILKAIVDTMPEQLFPLFKEIYGKTYPEGTKIVLLNTETSTLWEGTEAPPGSTFMDIALVVGGTDYYHLECQMRNEVEMVIRMFAYDVHFAITHAKSIDGDSGEITLRFPHSVVIYPENNSAIPDHLQCRILFQDDSEHIYKVPTVRIQGYSLGEIGGKHLTLFLPYTMLRFRTQKNLNKLTKKELTDYLNEIILILDNEASAGNLTEPQYRDYEKMIYHAAKCVFEGHEELSKEVDIMMPRLLRLPSDEYREMEAKIARQEAENAMQKEEIARQEAENAQLTSEIRRLQEQLRLAGVN